jgi:hypothetical protein
MHRRHFLPERPQPDPGLDQYEAATALAVLGQRAGRFGDQVQAACMLAFVCWPTGNVRVLPQPDGVSGLLFAQLRAFEAPFNMAPSLHAAVLVVVWQAWRQWLRADARALRWLWHGACGLILLSTLTTWQHDLLDVLAGLLVGALALWITRCMPTSLGPSRSRKTPAETRPDRR